MAKIIQGIGHKVLLAYHQSFPVRDIYSSIRDPPPYTNSLFPCDEDI